VRGERVVFLGGSMVEKGEMDRKVHCYVSGVRLFTI
jgi:hypothetical protein